VISVPIFRENHLDGRFDGWNVEPLQDLQRASGQWTALCFGRYSQ